MPNRIGQVLVNFSAQRSIGDLLLVGFVVRLIAVLYSVCHDSYVDHIKYTDIDYIVFSNASEAIVEGRSPFQDTEYRYSPLVALTFTPNIVINPHFGKLILISVDIVTGHLLYRLNLYQGTNRLSSKLFVTLWLFNPVTVAISTRGSFEPILTLVILAFVYYLSNSQFILSGLLYGLSIHLKIYPIIYAFTIYIYIIQRRPLLKTQTKLKYWIKTLTPNRDHINFFVTTLVAIAIPSYLSFRLYGNDYLNQSFIYHLKRKDLQHNFSVYFYIFRLLPNHQDHVGVIAFLLQFIGVLYLSLKYLNLDTNRRIKLRRLTFSLFATTFLFVSLNKVCTSQYFNWYLIFGPLILDSLKLGTNRATLVIASWLSSQANWLLFAYLFEYQKLDVLHLVGASSGLFLLSNLWILSNICASFDATSRRLSYDDSKES